jgi:hypothetical protein
MRSFGIHFDLSAIGTRMKHRAVGIIINVVASRDDAMMMMIAWTMDNRLSRKR